MMDIIEAQQLFEPSGTGSGENKEDFETPAGATSEKKKRGRAQTHPTKVWELLQKEEYRHIIAFNTDGDSVVIYDQEKFETEVLPREFPKEKMCKQAAWDSWMRQMNLYGFAKAGRKGTKDMLTFSHPYFHRDEPRLQEVTRGNAGENAKKERAAAMAVAGPKKFEVITEERAIDMTKAVLKAILIVRGYPAKENTTHPLLASLVTATNPSNGLFPSTDTLVNELKSSLTTSIKSPPTTKRRKSVPVPDPAPVSPPEPARVAYDADDDSAPIPPAPDGGGMPATASFGSGGDVNALGFAQAPPSFLMASLLPASHVGNHTQGSGGSPLPSLPSLGSLPPAPLVLPQASFLDVFSRGPMPITPGAFKAHCNADRVEGDASDAPVDAPPLVPVDEA